MKLVLQCFAGFVAANSHVDANLLQNTRKWFQGSRLSGTVPVTVSFGLRNRNVELLEQHWQDVSDPHTSVYGQHWSLADVTALTAPSEESRQQVYQWLRGRGITTWKQTKSKDFLEFIAPASWHEENFMVELWHYHHPRAHNITKVHSTKAYHLPQGLQNCVALVIGLTNNMHLTRTAFDTPDLSGSLYVEPSDQRKWYNIDPSYESTSSQNSWAIYAGEHQYFSDSDRKAFDRAYGEDFVEMANVIGNNDESRPGIEANGDTEYGMALAKGVPTTFWYVDGGVYEWAKQMADTETLPLVFSVSYAMDNADQLPTDEVQFLNQQFQKVGLRGSSIFFASGDDGAKGYQGTSSHWEPDFPADLPSVTAVGGVGHGSTPGAASLTGGGFSEDFARPDYQDSDVAHYLETASGLPSEGGWSKHQNNRGFPDVSAACSLFDIRVKGSSMPGTGTSNSAPAVAAMFALLNDVRMKSGQAPFGFVNPWLYKVAAPSGAITDVVHGNNGFPAAVGWDPASGLGVMDWGKLKDLVQSQASEGEWRGIHQNLARVVDPDFSQLVCKDRKCSSDCETESYTFDDCLPVVGGGSARGVGCCDNADCTLAGADFGLILDVFRSDDCTGAVQRMKEPVKECDRTSSGDQRFAKFICGGNSSTTSPTSKLHLQPIISV